MCSKVECAQVAYGQSGPDQNSFIHAGAGEGVCVKNGEGVCVKNIEPGVFF